MTAVVTSGAVRFVGTTHDGVSVFLGIPYAEPPMGERRFARARPRALPAGDFAADTWGATPQRGTPYAHTVIPEPSIEGEDTLTLNVFAPASQGAGAKEKLPTLVWIHGGGYVSGSPASSWYDGSPLARQGIVVVSVSYRLGLEGFGAAGSASNRALSDWLCALRWVHEHIADFGGDPDRVTVAGQSAGGGAVLTLLAAPSAQALFHRAVALSPVDVSLPKAELSAVSVAAAETIGVAVSALPQVNAERLQTASVSLASAAFTRGAMAFAPEHGDDLLPLPTTQALYEFGLDKPLLIGSTRDEFSPRPLTSGPDDNHELSEARIHASCARTARARAGAGKTWLYRYEWSSPVDGRAGHCADVPFFLGTTARATAVLGAAPPTRLAATMMRDFADFVRGKDPQWHQANGRLRDHVRIYSADGAHISRSRFDVAVAMLDVTYQRTDT